MHHFLEKHRAAIEHLCQKYKVKNLYFFGSLAKGGFNPRSSDADFIVSFQPLSNSEFARNYLNLLADLSAVLRRPVDLLLDEPVKNPFFQAELNETKQLFYGQEREKIPV